LHVRLVTWNCCMALHRKLDALLRLRPDIAIICECAEPQRLAGLSGLGGDPVWTGDNRHKGLAVFAFNGYAVRLADPFHPTLRHVAPVRVTGPTGPTSCNLLAVWAQNGSGGVSRKRQLGPLRRALTK